MQFLTIDFETYYDQQFSLSKMTTEEYIRSPRFQAIGVGVKVNGGNALWFSGPHDDIKIFLQRYDWDDSIAIAHNAMFDAAILNWIFGIRPYKWADTLSMARAIDGLEVSGSLKAAAERYGLGAKGEEVIHALGKHREDFSEEELARYGQYCKNDCDLTWALFNVYINQVSEVELRTIDLTLRMFSEPVLELDLPKLEQHLNEVRERKDALIQACSADPEVLQSNPKFAALLTELGADPPTKVSATTGKETWAFAKTDEGFKALADHPDERVQAVVAARLGTKSTLEETRTERFIGIAERGPLPVPLSYYAAHTGRWGGSDSLNLQNLPRGGALKDSILPPDGHVIIDCDSSQIEARVLAWLAGQEDLVEAFKLNNEEKARGVKWQDSEHDVYKIMASRIYGVDVKAVDERQRFMGKTVVLGCGYGMGAVKFRTSLKASGVELSEDECKQIIQTYRDSNRQITALWGQANRVLDAMYEGMVTDIGTQPQALYVDLEGLVLPSGYHLRYTDLEKGDDGYSYKTRKGRTKIYGGKVVENVVQALARCVIAQQLVWVSNRYRPVLTVHDAIAIVAPADEATDAQEYLEKCMRRVPSWAAGLPLNCESGIGETYGDC